jgi:hypothetical protein
LVILRLQWRRLVWTNVTANPTAEWIARQIVEAFPWDEAPRYLIRDRDTSYGAVVTRRLRTMGIRDRPITPRSPWQNGHIERLIGSIRRKCLDHVVVFGERHLRHLLAKYSAYYDEARTQAHLARMLAFDFDPSVRAWRRACSAQGWYWTREQYAVLWGDEEGPSGRSSKTLAPRWRLSGQSTRPPCRTPS